MEYGVMIDLSRGRVLTVRKIKEVMYIYKNLGYTYINLYLEDLITLDEYPQYGFMRGKYSDLEIAELVDYGLYINLGVYPAIQTLGHLEHFLKWKESSSLRDTNQVLRVTNDDTVEFINALISKCSQLFKSDKINIGMDEAFDLGMGHEFQATGEINQKKLYFDFLEKVVAICKSNNYNRIKIWSDMVFNCYSNTGENELYNLDLPIDVESLDENVELVFWNYWSREQEEYEQTIDAHRKFSSQVSVALGIHTWGMLGYVETQLEITKTALAACETRGIKDILFTMWGDDGSFYNLDSAIYGAYLTANLFNSQKMSDTQFTALTNLNICEMKEISNFNNIGINPVSIVWNDPITNLFYKSISDDDIIQLKKRIENILNCGINSQFAKVVYNTCLADINLYLKRDQGNCEKAIKNYQMLFKLVEEEWLNIAKLEGLEVIQSRFSSKIYRIEFMKNKLNDERMSKLLGDNSYRVFELDTNYNEVSKPTNYRW